MGIPEEDARTYRAVQQCLMGSTGEFARAFFVESGIDDAFLDGVVTVDDVVLVTSEYRAGVGGAFRVEYEGAAREPGDEFHIAGHRIEVQDYVSAAFSEPMGPTVVALADTAGWKAFVEDADLARRTGVLPAPLIDPRMQLADRAALSEPWRSDPPRCVWIRGDGVVSAGARGRALGPIADVKRIVDTPCAGSAAIDGAIDGQALHAALDVRPWIGRYLRVADLVRALRLDLGVDAVSGFGWAVVDDGAADAEPVADDPILLRTAGELQLADLSTRRRQRLAEATAAVVEIVQTSGDAERADERIAARLGIGRHRARQLSIQAIAELGVRRGRLVRAGDRRSVAAEPA